MLLVVSCRSIHYDSIPVHDIGSRYRLFRKKRVHRPVRIGIKREIEIPGLVVFRKLRIRMLPADSDYNEILVISELGQHFILDSRQFMLAWRTPCSKETQIHHFTSQLHAGKVSVDIGFQNKIRKTVPALHFIGSITAYTRK